MSGYGVVRTVEEAKGIAAGAKRENLRGCYPAAAVVLAEALDAAFDKIAKLEKELICHGR
jgi:hypothetical protein